MRKLPFLLLLLVTAIAVRAQSQRAPDEFQQQVLPVLTKTCAGCHNDRALAVGFSFEGIREAAAAAQKPDLWQKVLNKVSAAEMPPRPAAPLSAADSAAVLGWIRKLPSVAASNSVSAGSNATANPGRV